ncbi:MAG: hypothetical protein MK085_02410 [Phycisphaerales bacterium]|nr:hypothetical protein [Phycisphaerales bacterium]
MTPGHEPSRFLFAGVGRVAVLLLLLGVSVRVIGRAIWLFGLLEGGVETDVIYLMHSILVSTGLIMLAVGGPGSPGQNTFLFVSFVFSLIGLIPVLMLVSLGWERFYLEIYSEHESWLGPLEDLSNAITVLCLSVYLAWLASIHGSRWIFFLSLVNLFLWFVLVALDQVLIATQPMFAADVWLDYLHSGWLLQSLVFVGMMTSCLLARRQGQREDGFAELDMQSHATPQRY